MRKELEKRIRKQQAEIADFDKGITELQIKKVAAQAVLKELDSLLKSLPKEDDEPVKEKQLRKGTDVYEAREVLRIWKQPLYIDKIITYMNQEATNDRRRSLASQIAAYVRDNQIFTRPAPNTFGLKEFENQNTQADIDFSHVTSIDNENQHKGGAGQGEAPEFPF